MGRRVIIPITSLLLFSCITAKHAEKIQLTLHTDYCIYDAGASDEKPSFFITNIDSLIAKDTLLKRLFSRKEILLANATGTISQIQRLLRVSCDSGNIAEMELQVLSRQIQGKVSLVRQDINTIVAELSCEAVRTKRAADYLDNLNKKRINRLTVGAIFAGALTTVAPIIIHQQGAQNGVVIAGAGLSTAFGLTALLPGNKSLSFTYDVNFLKDIWYGPTQSSTYPFGIWFLLTQKQFNSVDADLSLQQNLKKRWLNLEFNHNLNPMQENLIFGNGGIFGEDDLNTRVILLTQLEAAIGLLDTQIEQLSKAINRIKI